MALITTGKKFIRELESAGALGVYVPPEGGHEGRYQRRLRTAGYALLDLSAPGLGDPASYLTRMHGVRPAHLGKSTSGSTAWGIQVHFLPPIANYYLENLSENGKGLVLWLLDGKRLDRRELQYLCQLPNLEPRVKVVIELGGDRQFRWQPLKQIAEA